MNNTTDELAVARVNRATDNTRITPGDLLKTLMHDMDSGEVKCNTLFIMAGFKHEDGSLEIAYYRCNVNRMEEVALCEIAKRKALEDWLGD